MSSRTTRWAASARCVAAAARPPPPLPPAAARVATRAALTAPPLPPALLSACPRAQAFSKQSDKSGKVKATGLDAPEAQLRGDNDINMSAANEDAENIGCVGRAAARLLRSSRKRLPRSSPAAPPHPPL